MIVYYLRLAATSLRRTPVLTTLMVLAVAVGIGASMTALTVLRAMGNNPYAYKNDRLYVPQLDNWNPQSAYDEEGNPPNQFTWLDARGLLDAGKADLQSAMYATGLAVTPENPDVLRPFNASIRAAGADFFALFDVPFRHGAPWSRIDDRNKARVVVLGSELNDKLFGGENSVGRDVRLGDEDYRVVGVLDDWLPMPRVYDVISDTFTEPEQAFIPWEVAIDKQMGAHGNNNCFRSPEQPGWEGRLQSECIWMQFWVGFDQASDATAYRAFLDDYVREQKKLGRFERPLNNRLSPVDEWLERNDVVARDSRIQVWIAFGFLAVCVVNTVGLLLAKFLGRAGEIGVRRALGASRKQIFAQFLTEAGVIGVAGGAIGLLLTGAMLAGMRLLQAEGFAHLTRIDGEMVVITLTVAVLATLLAGLIPTWRACQIAPALQLKSQ